MAIIDRLRSIILTLAVSLLAIAGDRLINMLWIGHPFTASSTRGWVYQLCAAAGVSMLILVMVLGRRR